MCTVRAAHACSLDVSSVDSVLSYYLLIVEVWSLRLRKSIELKYSSSRKHESILVHAVSRLCSTTVLHIRKVRFRKVMPER